MYVYIPMYKRIFNMYIVPAPPDKRQNIIAH